MKTWYTLLLLLLGTALTAQSLRPVDLVAQRLDQGERFRATELVQPSRLRSARVAELDAEATSYQVLDLNRAGLERLRAEAPEAITLTLPTSARSGMDLQLVRVEVLADDFRLVESATNAPVDLERGVHYRGVVAGDDRSVVALSIFGEELVGLIARPEGNYVIGKLEDQGFRDGEHVIYEDQQIMERMSLDCGTADDGYVYTREELSAHPQNGRALDDCVRIYLEVDDNVYDARGSLQNTNNFITGVFNQMATIYANEQINLELSEIYVWTTQSPYNSNSSSGMLSDFQQTSSNFNGDLAGLVSFRASGGIAAGFSGLCNSVRARSMCFSNIQNGYATVPSYSWTVDVITHEFGHLFGSRHTHACVWNGNGTAIDGCYQTEGSCRRPGVPSAGGTIMSYCHLQNAGKDLALGFGPQPGNVIRNSVSTANCLNACGDDDGGGDGGDDGCDGNTVELQLVLDRYPGETTWELTDESGTTVASGGPYSGAGSVKRESFCLPDGCYTFTIFDSYGDGICCAYGNGSFAVTDSTGATLISGGQFAQQDAQDFCIGKEADPEPPSSCLTVDFNDYTIRPYGDGQDFGTIETLDGGNVIKLSDNAWKSLALDYTVTESTVIEFDFGSTAQGEIHGIGFDNDDAISDNRTFKVYGTQGWGINNFDNYSNVGYWESYRIPVGQFYTGTFDRLFFVADDDSRQRDGTSYFRNIRIYEGSACSTAQPPLNEPLPGAVAVVNPARIIYHVFPNPVSDRMNIQIETPQAATIQLGVYTLTGQQLLGREVAAPGGSFQTVLETNSLPAGIYLLRLRQGEQTQVTRIQVVR